MVENGKERERERAYYESAKRQAEKTVLGYGKQEKRKG